MAHDDRTLASLPAEAIALSHRQTLLLERSDAETVLRIVGADGAVSLTVSVTAAGPVLRFEGAAVTIQTSGALVLDAERVAIHGREAVAISSGGDLSLAATLGSVAVEAHDDVNLNGERIRLNC